MSINTVHVSSRGEISSLMVTLSSSIISVILSEICTIDVIFKVK